MSELVLCSAAEADYSDAFCWYADQRLGLAEQFEAQFSLTLDAIAIDPARYPKCDERHHFALMRQFPYQVIFRQHELRWVVIAVAHVARATEFWDNR